MSAPLGRTSGKNVPISILSTGTGLGTYIPAVLIQRQLTHHGYRAEVEVLEEYYTPKKQAEYLALREACHKNFKLAQLAHRATKDVTDCLDEKRVAAMLANWAEQGRTRFIVWCGFWLPLIEQYREMTNGASLRVEHCRIDAVKSASFKIYQELDAEATEIWLWHGPRGEIVNEIVVNSDAPIPFRQRCDRLVVHGGGWNLGTYAGAASDLSHTEFALDVVIDNPGELDGKRPGDRLFRVDPAWTPWSRGAGGERGFPPVGQLDESGSFRYRNNSRYHEFYNVVRQSKAIISKPGGGTLIDSLNSATPVILLEPYGYAEQSNSDLWRKLGLGILFKEWKQAGCGVAVLEQLHDNLMQRRRTAPDYVVSYLHRMREQELA